LNPKEYIHDPKGSGKENLNFEDIFLLKQNTKGN